MRKQSRHTRRYLTSALAVAIMLTEPLAASAETWFPDLLFPKTELPASTDVDGIVTGTNPLGRHRTTNDRSRTVPSKALTEGHSKKAKEIQQ